jgi:hypothetical protein
VSNHHDRQEGDFTIETAEPRPLVDEGDYFATSVSTAKDYAFKRYQLRIAFALVDDNGEAGPNVDGFFPMPAAGRRAAPSTKLARLTALLPDHDGRISSARLRGQRWRVRVRTVTHDAAKRPLTRPYSQVEDVLAWLGSAAAAEGHPERVPSHGLQAAAESAEQQQSS